jgi:signal transduction histidine kinase
VAEVVGSVVRVNRACADKVGLTVEAYIPAALPRLWADELRTRQVLFNLIGNAIKFTPPGGRIEVRACADAASGMRITVADTGIGITPEDLPRVVEPFVQAGGALSRHHAGTGLGLSAVKAIMELHGGALELQSTPGVGTEAAVIFPPGRIATAAAEAEADAASVPAV